MSSVGKLVGKIPLKTLHTPHPDFLNSSTLIGVEIEAESAVLPKGYVWEGMQYWNPHADDSLRNNGCEYAFVAPLFGSDAVAALRGLCNVAAKKEFKVSARTGLHVHVDVRDMDMIQFRSMCVLYSMVEKMIYRWVGDNREENIFCLPWYHSEGDLDLLGSAFTTKGEGDVHGVFNNLLRYSGLNLQAVAKFGSAEFRHMTTTFDYERIRTWINIILALRDAATAWQSTPEALLKEFRVLGCMKFMSKVFPLSVLKELWYPDAPKDTIESGLITAEHLLRISSPGTNRKINFDSLYTRYKTLRGKHEGITAWESKNKPLVSSDPIEEYNHLVMQGMPPGADPASNRPSMVLIIGTPSQIGHIPIKPPKGYIYNMGEWVVEYDTLMGAKANFANRAPALHSRIQTYIKKRQAALPPSPEGMFSYEVTGGFTTTASTMSSTVPTAPPEVVTKQHIDWPAFQKSHLIKTPKVV